MEPPAIITRDSQPNRRRLDATSAQPLTTAEIQAQRHGISSDISNALQSNVPSRVRQAVNNGRSSAFGRTQSQPVLPNPNYSFATSDQIMREAQNINHKDERRRQARELQPYGSAESSEINALDLAGSSGAEREKSTMRLRFGENGEVEMDGEDQSFARGSRTEGKKMDWGMSQGKKRGAEGEADIPEGDVSDTATEVDEDEGPPVVSGTGGDEFPPVFTSPAISHPDLFRSNRFPAVPPAAGRRAGPPATTHMVAGGRQMRGLPGRALGKTMSAPVFGRSSGMEVDEPAMSTLGADGFDVGEWAEDTNF